MRLLQLHNPVSIQTGPRTPKFPARRRPRKNIHVFFPGAFTLVIVCGGVVTSNWCACEMEGCVYETLAFMAYYMVGQD